MKIKLQILIFALATFAGARNVTAQGTAFTYQGQLNDGGSPANGSYDLTFTVHATNAPPDTAIAGPLTNTATAVSNGLFTVVLDFGAGIFTGAPRWLEIGVRSNGLGAFATLAPRQALTPTPYAIMAGSASNLLGPLPSAQLAGSYGNPVNFNNGADSFDGTFSGEFFGSTFTGGSFTGSFVGSGNGLIDVWHTEGNLGTTAGPNFLGTTDNQALELHVNNTRVLRLEPDPRGGNAGNLIGGLPFNAVSQQGSGGDVIAGGGFTGGPNLILSNSSGVFIGAGSINQAGPNVNDSVIAGGYGNTMQSGDSVISGGYYNTIQPASGVAVIGGGEYNTIATNAALAVIGGGYANLIQTNSGYSVIGGGYNNVIQPSDGFSVIGGGYNNVIQPSPAEQPPPAAVLSMRSRPMPLTASSARAITI